jgi:hypothetical protein
MAVEAAMNMLEKIEKTALFLLSFIFYSRL